MLVRFILVAIVFAIVGCSLQMFRTLRERPAVDDSTVLVVQNHAQGPVRDAVDQIFNARLARTNAVVQQAIDPPNSYCEVLARDPETLERIQWLITSPGRFDFFLVDDESYLKEYRKELLVTEKPNRKLVWPAGEPKTLEHAIVVKTDSKDSVQDLRFDSAAASADLYGSPALRATLAPADARQLTELTEKSVGKQIVITIDGVAVVVATITSKLGAEILITGTDALPVPLEDVVAVARSGPFPDGTALEAKLIHR